MKKRRVSIKVSATAGTVSGECYIPAEPKCILIIAHGAGAGMNHPFMIALAQSLCDMGITTLRYNFPFMENKKGRPDSPAVAHATIEKATAKAEKLFPGLPLFSGGKSFGGRMTSQFLSTHYETSVRGVVFYGFPLHPPGKPSKERAEHLKTVKVPMLFLQGTRDELASWKLIGSVCSGLRRAELVKIEGANHAFKAGKLDTMSILSEETSKWIDKRLKRR